MAYWGQALVLGPNINAMMEPNDEPHADELVQEGAVARGHGATPRERALIEALDHALLGQGRSTATPTTRPTPTPCGRCTQQFPDDLDIAMLYVESMMDLRPVGLLDARRPAARRHRRDRRAHRGRHAPQPEASGRAAHVHPPDGSRSRPEKAEPAADALLPLLPDAGHMVHMPSHIYQRVGRYADAMKSNELAIKADERLHHAVPGAGPVPDGLLPAQHPLPVVRGLGRRPERRPRLDAARKVAAKIDDKALAEIADHRRLPRRARTGRMARFGQWDAILKEPEPPAASAFLRRRVALRPRPGVRGQGPARGRRQGAGGAARRC